MLGCLAPLQSFLDPRSTIPAWITKLQIGLTVFKLGVLDGAFCCSSTGKPSPLPVLKFLARILKRRANSDTGRAYTPLATTSADQDAAGSANLCVMRHAVLNREKKVVGYAFFQSDASHLAPIDPDAERSFLAFLESVTTSAALGKRRAIAKIPARLLFDPALERLASAGVAVMIHFDAEIKDLGRLTERMQSMHKLGMLVGVSDARIALLKPELGKCASIAFLQVDQVIAPDLLQTVRLLRTEHPQIQLIACGVNSYEEFEVCRKLRVHGFTGPFVTHRRDWQDKPIDPGTLRLCKLVNSLRAGLEMGAIIDEIKLDPLLSFRILCYANSAAIGSENRILALKDAIMLIGREPLFRWLVLLLCASAPSNSESSALLENALVRGRMMEILSGDVSASAPEDFFLTGVLSLLDVILQVPASALLDALNLPDEVKAALQERTGPYAGLLRLAEAAEQAGTEGVADLCSGLGIGVGKLSDAHNAALIWARGKQRDGDDEPTSLFTPPVAVAALAQSPAIDKQQAQEPDSAARDKAASTPVQPSFVSDPSGIDATQPDDPDAQLKLGSRYALGEGVPKDLTKALAWYTKAAEQGNAKAQWNVAVMHAQGLGGVEKDAQNAAMWHLKSAAQGFAPSQASLGLMYASGLGVKKDASKAVALLQLAAQQGDVEAQYNLAVMFEQGADGEVELAQALVWFSKAAEQGLPIAQEKLGVMYAVGQSVKQDLIEAYKWFFIACKGNLDTAKANLAHCLELLDAQQVSEAESRAELWIHDHAC